MQSAIITHLPDMMALRMIYLLPHVHFHGYSLCICKEILLPARAKAEAYRLSPRNISSGELKVSIQFVLT